MAKTADGIQVEGTVVECLRNANFRVDVNANGLINSTDTAIVQSKSGTGLP